MSRALSIVRCHENKASPSDYHWSLLLGAVDGGTHMTYYDVQGGPFPTPFKRVQTPATVTSKVSSTFMDSSLIANISADKVAKAIKVMTTVEPDYAAKYNCQSWIVDVMYVLEEDGIISDAQLQAFKTWKKGKQ